MLKVVTPATSRDLTTLNAVKRELQITAGDVSKDDWLRARITSVSSQIEFVLRRKLALEVLEETRFVAQESWGSTRPLILSRRPIVEVTAVTVGSQDLTEDEWGPYTDPASGGDGYEAGLISRLDANGRPCPWSHRREKVVVSYTAGYALPGADSPTLPPVVEQACLEMVKEAYQLLDVNPAIMEEQIEGVSRTRYATGNLSRVNVLLPGLSDETALKLMPLSDILV